MIITILKFIGILVLVFVLWQALFNPWTPIYWYVRKWQCNISDFFKKLATAPKSGTEKYRILIQDWNDSDWAIRKKHNWPNAIAFQLQFYGKKYWWSKPDWILLGGAGGGTMDLKFVASCVNDWSKSYPQAEIINKSKTFK
jgi:hypothetical protein